MAFHILSLETIGDLEDGRISKQFDKLLQEAVADCNLRAGDGSERKITLTAIIKPDMNEMVGGCDNVNARFELSSRLPKRSSRTINMGRKANNKLVFNDLAPDDHRQGTIDQAIAQNQAAAAQQSASESTAQADPEEEEEEDGDEE